MAESQSAGGLLLKLINGEMQVLLVEHMDNTWVFPKGHVEDGESPEDAAVREIKEESGYDSRVVQQLGEVVRGSRQPDGSIRDQRRITMFLAEADAEEPASQGEERTRWFSFEDAIRKLRYEEDGAFLEQHQDLFKV